MSDANTATLGATGIFSIPLLNTNKDFQTNRVFGFLRAFGAYRSITEFHADLAVSTGGSERELFLNYPL